MAVDDLKLGATNRTSYEQMLAGGKGINVSYVLKNLGVDSTALGFMAGFVGEEIRRRIQEEGIHADFLMLDEGVSRINVKIRNIDGTEINGMGPDIPKDKVDELMQKTGGYADTCRQHPKVHAGYHLYGYHGAAAG